MSAHEEKVELRRLVRQTRAARSNVDLAAASARLSQSLQALSDEFNWRRIAAFLPTQSEPPIALFLEQIVSGGIDCIVPISGDDGLLDWVGIQPGFATNLAVDSQGMPIPGSGPHSVVGTRDAVLVPAAAVDRHGNRLGWGKGYYDRFLETVDSETLVVAVVFDSDVLDEVPIEAHDRAVDFIVTEVDIYRTTDNT